MPLVFINDRSWDMPLTIHSSAPGFGGSLNDGRQTGKLQFPGLIVEKKVIIVARFVYMMLYPIHDASHARPDGPSAPQRFCYPRVARSAANLC
jgi:hypothetical protein